MSARIIKEEWVIEDPATKEYRLRGCICPGCGAAFFPVRLFCGKCLGADLNVVPLSTEGVLNTFTTVYSATPGYLGKSPYVVGKVDLPEGARVRSLIMADINGQNPSNLKIGMKMKLVFENIGPDTEGKDVICHMFQPVNEGECAK